MSKRDRFEFLKAKDFTQPEVLDAIQGTWIKQLFGEKPFSVDHLDPEDIDRRFAHNVNNWIKKQKIIPMKAGAGSRSPRLFSLKQVYELSLYRIMAYQALFRADQIADLAPSAVECIFNPLKNAPDRFDARFLLFVQRSLEVDDIHGGSYFPQLVRSDEIEMWATGSLVTIAVEMLWFDRLDEKLMNAIKLRGGAS